MTINKRVKYIRNSLNLTQEEFGKKLTVAQTYLSQIESGARDVTEKILKLICLQYNVNENWLRTGEGDIFNKEKENKISELLEEYDLGIYGRKILEIYLSLDISQKKVINDFLKKFVDEFQSEQQESQEN
mgnify:CR=1 FL=1